MTTPIQEPTMPCHDLGALRASLDDVPGVTPAPLHDHVRGCAACLDTLAELRRNAELAAPAIAMTGPDVPPPPAVVEATLARLEQRRARAALPPTPGFPRPVPQRALPGHLARQRPGDTAPDGHVAAGRDRGVTSDRDNLDGIVEPTPARDLAAASRLAGFPVQAVAASALPRDVGASLEELRELALRLPGLPEQTVAELRDISDWRNTLPLPVPTNQARWRPATVNGAEALSFADPTGKLHALLWQRGGHIWGVAGVISSREAVDVADSLG
jgi:hypothetical protein